MLKHEWKPLDNDINFWVRSCVYDSMNLALTSSMKKIIADLLHQNTNFILINYENMQYQIGGSDCGLFAIATACSGENPTELKYDQGALLSRTRLLATHFPSVKRRGNIQSQRSDMLEVA